MMAAIRTWYRKCADRGPWWAMKWTAFAGAYRTLPLSGGETHVYDREWDLLIVLDACRPDALRAIAPAFDFLDGVGSIRSVGSSSGEWLRKTFGDDRHASAVAETAYITGNPHSDFAIDHDRFAHVEEVWRTEWDDDLGTILPGSITDAAVRVCRESNAGRAVVHYMQPHFPSLSGDLGGAIDPSAAGAAHGKSIWLKVRRGEVSLEAVRRAYMHNLSCVLDEVGLLIKNVDAPRAVITADHGNAFGEWGFYGHHGYTPLAAMRQVPWAEVTAVDQRTHVPTRRAPAPGGTVEGRLADLGYV